MGLKSAVTAFCILSLSYTFVSSVDVSTKYGIVRGQTLELDTGFRVNTFLGIPYAKPPVGSLRWVTPQEPDPWSTPFIANKYGHMCPQNGSALRSTHPEWNDFDEDCLHLNIYAPNNSATAGPYPVMFYIHGGGYANSGSIQYPGHFLSANDIVAVVINYRQSILGFMSTGDNTVATNVGLRDQLQALAFVRENIANFGGDPNSVTIFGQSAGGACVGLQMMSPLSSGQFHRAICQSGSEMSAWAYGSVEHRPERNTRSVAAKVGCNRTINADMVECMRGINATTLINTNPDFLLDGPQIPFSPYVDGEGGFLPDDVDVLREQGRYNKVPLLSGITTEDAAVILTALVPETVEGGFNRSEYQRLLRRLVFDLLAGEDPYRLEQVYQAFHHQYTNWPHVDDIEGNRQSFLKLVTDSEFGLGLDLQVKSQSRDVATYMYLFGLRTANMSEVMPEWMGVPHMSDVPYVFGFPHLKNNPAVAQETGITLQYYFDDVDVEYSSYIMTLFTNMAKSGNPTPNPVPAPGNNPATTWPAFDNTDLQYLLINRTNVVGHHYRQRDFALWTDYLPWILTHNTTSSVLPTPINQRKFQRGLMSKSLPSSRY